MSDIAIRVEGLGKQYRIGGQKVRYRTIRETLVDGVQAPWRRAAAVVRGQSSAAVEETIWALKDVSFKVERGEVVGIIGRNGAGKTTLLKILSRITEPTEGGANVYGRVGSLLEVGTGFHPELTGRENITLNGAILGMRRTEIERKFDEIVAFAEVERFLETPVKHYSSGMYVRLAFAVAAHLEPEILLVDEVLAVGDRAFQKKCLGKIGEVAGEGRTVLFVSHNVGMVQHLCPSSILLDSGHLAGAGSSAGIIADYLQTDAHSGQVVVGSHTARQGSGRARYSHVRLLDAKGRITSAIPVGHSLTVELEFRIREGTLPSPSYGIALKTGLGQPITRLITRETRGVMPPATQGGVVRLHINQLNLLPGVYHLTVSLSDRLEQLDLIEDILSLEITPWPVYPTGKLPPTHSGPVYVPCSWTHDYS